MAGSKPPNVGPPEGAIELSMPRSPWLGTGVAPTDDMLEEGGCSTALVGDIVTEAGECVKEVGVYVGVDVGVNTEVNEGLWVV